MGFFKKLFLFITVMAILSRYAQAMYDREYDDYYFACEEETYQKLIEYAQEKKDSGYDSDEILEDLEEIANVEDDYVSDLDIDSILDEVEC